MLPSKFTESPLQMHWSKNTFFVCTEVKPKVDRYIKLK